jgi:hypothetical protein
MQGKILEEAEKKAKLSGWGLNGVFQGADAADEMQKHGPSGC